MTSFDQIVTKIIKEQEQLMGPVAWQEASKVKGLHIQNADAVSIDAGNDNGKVVDNLVNQYSNLFGRAAREVCKEAVASLVADLSPADVPVSLR